MPPATVSEGRGCLNVPPRRKPPRRNDIPAWIHNRALHLMAKNPAMPKGEAWAIATQQAHASGNSPKSYGTKEGRKKAKAKYHGKPASYEQTADPSSKDKSSGVDLALLKGFSDELQKIAAAMPGLGVRTATQLQKRMGSLPKPVTKITPAIGGTFASPPTGKLTPAKVTVPGLASVAGATQRTPPGAAGV